MSYTVAFVLGGGKWAAMGLLLARSVSEFTECEQVIFIPADEADAVPAAIREECATHGTLYEAPPINSAYPIATKLQAFHSAAENAATDTVVLLDTDTLVLDSLDHSELASSELTARPANFASRRWETGMGEALDPELFDRFGYEFPTEQVDGAVDGTPMPACWNAGVVGTTDETFPNDWLSLTLELYDEMDHQRFADQLALAMLGTDRNITQLPPADNFPAAFRFRFPSTVRILHYHGFHHLLRIRNEALRAKFRQIGLREVRQQYVDEPVYTSGLKHLGTNLSHRVVGW